MNIYRIATSPGDGISKEVVPAGRQVLDVLASGSRTFAVEVGIFDWGGDYYRNHDVMMPGAPRKRCKPEDLDRSGTRSSSTR